MKKRNGSMFAAASCLVVAAMALGGCSSGQENAKSTEVTGNEASGAPEISDTSGGGAQEGEETLRVITYFAGSDQWAPTWLEVIEEYQELHPNITINDESVPTAGTNDLFRPKMNADIAAGTPVDVALYFNGSDAEPLYESGLYVTWDQYFEEDPEWAAQFNQTALESGVTGGEQFNLPYIGSFEGLVYNKAIFDQYDLEYPTSWENIYKAVEVLAETDIIPMANTLLNPTCQLETMLLAYVGPDGQKIPLDDSWAGCIDQIAKLYKMGAFPADAATISDADTRVVFEEGRAAMTFTGSWVLNQLKSNPDMEMVAVPTDIEGGKGKEGAIISTYGSGWYMSKAAAERSSAALDFIKYMCSPEILARFIEVGGSPAMNIEIAEGSENLLVSANEMVASSTAMNPPIDAQIPREVFNNLAKKLIYVCEDQMTSQELLDECRQMLESIEAN